MKLANKDGKCCNWRDKGAKGLYFLGAVLFGALGFAAMIHGIILQLNLGFTYGFVGYLIGLLFIGAAKCCKMRMHESCCPDWHMMKD
ncbi:MAG TPA: hypothetical protein HA362_02975 [Nanoarchaeota archaeon]|nr:hypothetical protein [Nanoarchaeota archaeon]